MWSARSVSLVAWIGALASCSRDPIPTVTATSTVSLTSSTSIPTPVAASVADPEPAPELELTFVGDIVLGRYQASERYVELHPPDQDPFFAAREQLAADVVVGNLESPVMFELPVRSPSTAKNRFAGSAAHVEQLADAGFTVMSLANNHFFDLGVDGQLESPKALSEAGIFAIGASRTEGPLLRIETLEARGWRIGFVAFTTRHGDRGDPNGPQVPLLSLPQLEQDLLVQLRAARADHDLLIVAVHWGVEYQDDPGLTRRLLAHHLLAAGVDLVIGHHPHVLQAIERHRSGDDRDGLIAYSLGNFLFHRGDRPAGLSGVLRVRYRAGLAGQRPCLEEARVHPIVIVQRPRWAPIPAIDQTAADVRERVRSLSRALGTRWVREGQPNDADRGEDLLVTGLRACPRPLQE